MKDTRTFLIRYLLRTALFIAGTLLLMSVGASAQVYTNAAERAKNRVVMIEGRFGEHKTFGAGIILSKRENRIYLVTVKHVVRRSDKNADKLRVRFKFLPGESFPASVLDVDPTLDLAVIGVLGLRDQYRAIESMAYDALAEAKLLRAEDSLHAIGFPGENPWFVSAIPERYLERIGSQIFFQSDTLAQGYSGGALFNDNWELLALIQADEPPKGRAIALERVLENVGDWGYPADFRTAAGIGGNWIGRNNGQKISFTFKVVGHELYGTVIDEKHRKGILNGKIEGDRIAFYTTQLLKHRTSGGIISQPGRGFETVPDQYSFERIRTFYRGTVKSDQIDFIRQSEAGDPPDSFYVTRSDTTKKIKLIRGWMGVDTKTVSEELVTAFGIKDWKGDAVIIDKIARDSPASEVLQVDDIILNYDDVSITEKDELDQKVAETSPGSKVALKVFRRGKSRDLTITIGQFPEKK